MQVLTNSRLRIAWYTLIGIISLVSLWPGVGLRGSLLGNFIGHGMAHFVAYLVVACIALLAWGIRTGLAITLGIAILSVTLQSLRGAFAGSSIDVDALVVNLLGIAAGALLGLNILRLQSHSHETVGTKTQSN